MMHERSRRFAFAERAESDIRRELVRHARWRRFRAGAAAFAIALALVLALLLAR